MPASNPVRELQEVDNAPMSAAQVEVSLLLTEREDGTTNASLRSKGQLDVAQLAAHFASGSHTRAAGARLPMPPAPPTRPTSPAPATGGLKHPRDACSGTCIHSLGTTTPESIEARCRSPRPIRPFMPHKLSGLYATSGRQGDLYCPDHQAVR